MAVLGEADCTEDCDWYFGVPFKSKRAQAAKEREFKVGDRVRVVKPVLSFLNSVGVIGERTSSSGISLMFMVKFHDGDARYFWPDEIELLPHYARGTRIKLLRDHGVYKAGHRGTVTYENDENVGALMDIGRYAAFPHDVVEVDQGKQHAPDDAPAPWSAPDCAESKVERGEPELSEAAIAAALAAKPKFKAGDVVRVVDAGGGGALGDQATISSIDWDSMRGTYYYGLYGLSQGAVGLYEFRLQLVTPAPCPQENEQHPAVPSWAQPAIVIRIDDGKPKPAYCPHVHSDAASATTEAERLAANNPGKQFDVYVRATGRVAEKHIEMKEVA